MIAKRFAIEVATETMGNIAKNAKVTDGVDSAEQFVVFGGRRRRCVLCRSENYHRYKQHTRNMRTLQEIKDEFVVSKGFKNWEEFSICFFGAHIEHSLDELFFEVAKEALKNASEDFENNWDFGCESNKEISNSLLSEKYIPKI